MSNSPLHGICPHLRGFHGREILVERSHVKGFEELQRMAAMDESLEGKLVQLIFFKLFTSNKLWIVTDNHTIQNLREITHKLGSERVESAGNSAS